MRADLVEVQVNGLLPTPGGAGVFLVGEEKAITIFIDAMVSRALERVLEGQTPPRPQTHDLMRSMLDGLEVRPLRLVIHDLEDEVYYARLVLEQENELGRKVVEVDARPSDGLALAMPCGAPVFVARHVWDNAEDMRWALNRLDSEE